MEWPKRCACGKEGGSASAVAESMKVRGERSLLVRSGSAVSVARRVCNVWPSGGFPVSVSVTVMFSRLASAPLRAVAAPQDSVRRGLPFVCE